MTRLPAVAVLGLAAALGTTGCGGGEEAAAPEPVRPVKTVRVGGLAEGELTFPGLVEAGEKSLLSFRVPGRIVELKAEEGDEVPEGRVIARLDPRDYQITVEEARAEFTRAEADLERFQRLYENDAVPLADLQARRAARDVSAARLDEARRNLSYTELDAPFTGRIGRRYVENFMVVQANQEIVDLNAIDTMEISFDVSEAVIRRMRRTEDSEAIRVFAEFDNRPGLRFPLRFKEAANRADPTTQTFRVKFLMDQPDEFRLLPGMTATVRVNFPADGEVSGQDTPAVTIPAIAVVGDPEGDAYVWVVDPSAMTVSKRPVRLGSLTGTESVIVESGLRGGEVLVVAGLRTLSEGMEVSLWKPE
jgi:RND family efflux transporter MFP subunit